MYAAPYDLLAAALGITAPRVRAITSESGSVAAVRVTTGRAAGAFVLEFAEPGLRILILSAILADKRFENRSAPDVGSRPVCLVGWCPVRHGMSRRAAVQK